MAVTPPPVPYAPTLTRRIAEVAARCLARLAHPARRAELRASERQLRVDAAAQAAAREGRR